MFKLQGTIVRVKTVFFFILNVSGMPLIPRKCLFFLSFVLFFGWLIGFIVVNP